MGDAPRRTESGEHPIAREADRSAEVRERVAELADANTPWQDRQAAARALGEIGDADGALPALRQALANDTDYDVREATVIAIAALERDVDVLTEDLRTAMRDLHALVWRRATTLISERLSPQAATVALRERIDTETDWTALGDLGQALREVGDDEALVDVVLELLRTQDVDSHARAVLLVRTAKPEDVESRERVAEAIWDVLARLDGWVADEGFRRIIELTSPDVGVQRLLATAGLPGRLVLLVEIRGIVEAQMSYDPEPVLARYLEALSDPDEASRLDAAERLRVRVPSLSDEQAKRLVDGVRTAVTTRGIGLGLLASVDGDDAAIDYVAAIKPPTEEAARAVLIDARPLVEAIWPTRADDVLPIVLAGCDSPDWRVRQAAAQFLGAVADAIPGEELERVHDTLRRLTSDADTDVRQAADYALINVRTQRRRTNTQPLVALLTSEEAESEQAVQDAITKLVELKTPDAVRPLVQAWARWIGLRDRSGLVEFAAEKLRSSPHAVIPLLDQLEQGLPLDPAVEHRLTEDAIPREYARLAEIVGAGDKITRTADEALADDWLGVRVRAHREHDGAAAGVVDRTKSIAMLIVGLVEARRAERELLVRQRVSRQLAEMSDQRFFEDRPDALELVRAELKKHAIPILGRRLDGEDDSTIRENIARVLGNVGGREAVDVLARAVVGEERKRSNRQELLAEYYLKPSKELSDQAATILHGAVSEAKRTLRLLQALNVAFFVIALAILAGGFLAMVFGSSETVQILGGVAGLAGFAGIAVQLVREPLVRIQNAVTRLVQVETAFASFIWELNLNGTYIQSQYVAEGILSDDEIASTVDRIERAMHLSMDLVARYAEEGRVPMGPRLSSLSPQAGGPGSTLTAYGAGLKSAGRNGSARIAVNHVPIAAGSLEWSDSVVSFTLPDVLGEKIKPGEALWVSVLVDGQETNAVPFRLTGAARNGG